MTPDDTTRSDPDEQPIDDRTRRLYKKHLRDLREAGRPVDIILDVDGDWRQTMRGRRQQEEGDGEGDES